MNDPTRPPLDPRTFDLIELTWDQIDKTQWSFLEEKQVAPPSDPLISLPPSKVPNLLLNTFQVYAGNLFKAEADQYAQFKNDRNYATWLVNLVERVIARVFRTIEIIERANTPRTMAYHGLTDDKIRAGLSMFLLRVANEYSWQSNVPSPDETPPPPPAGEKQLGAKERAFYAKAGIDLDSASPSRGWPTMRPKNPKELPLSENFIGEQIRQFREECRLTNEDIADALGIDRRSVVRHISGDNKPSKRHIAAYEKVFSDKTGRTVRLKMSP